MVPLRLTKVRCPLAHGVGHLLGPLQASPTGHIKRVFRPAVNTLPAYYG